MTSSSKKTASRLYSRRWVKIFATIAGVFAIILLLLPVGTKYLLVDWLEKNGADSASIESLWFNPFKGSITLKGMDVQVDGKSLLSNSRIELDIGLGSLFSHDIRLERAMYQDLNIDLEQYGDGKWRFASYTVDGSVEEETLHAQESKVSAWAFLADQVLLRNCTIHLKTVDLEVTLVIEKAELDNFTTRPGESAATFFLKGQLNDGSVMIDLDHLQIVPDLVVDGKIVVSQLDLGFLAPMLKDVLHPFSGIAGLDGTIRFGQSSLKGMVVDYDGTIGLVEPELGNNDFITRAGQLNWKGKVQYAAPDNDPMVVVTDGMLSAGEYTLRLPNQDFVLNESEIVFAGKTTVTIADTVAVVSDTSLDVQGTDIQLPLMRITDESLLWKGKVHYTSGSDRGGLFVDTTGTLDLGGFLFNSLDEEALVTSRGQSLNWQGRVAYGWEKDAEEAAVFLDGTLLGTRMQTILKSQGLGFEEEKIKLTTTSRIGLGIETEVSGESSFTLDTFEIIDLSNETSLLTLDTFVIDGLQAPGGKELTVEDVWAGGLTAIVAGDFPVRIAVPEIALKGLKTEDMASFTVAGFLVKEPLVTSEKNHNEVLFLKSLRVENIFMNSSATVSAELVGLDSLRFLKAGDSSDEKTVCTLGGASLASLSWSQKVGLQGGTLHLSDALITVIRDKKGGINVTEQLQAMMLQPPQPETEIQPADTEKGDDEKTAFRLAAIKMTGENGFFFADYTLAVPFSTDLSISTLEIGEIDSTRADLKTTLLLAGEFEKRAPLDITGYISLFLEKPAMKMAVKLKNYPLVSLSAYTVQSVGTALAQGQLKLKTKFVLEDDMLDMENTIILKKLKTETISPELAEKLNNQLPIPLDTALSMLRDSKGNIELDIPLSGPVSDLNVGISDVLITALGKAIIPAATSYLVYTLGPYGALAYVGMKVGEKMLQVRLPPVVFVPRESSLTKEHKKYLERVGRILQDRPETDVQICPFVASWEFLEKEQIEAEKNNTIEIDENDRTRLVQLGQDRADAVKSHLENNYSIAANRLLLCNTAIETDKKAVVEVKLHM